MAIKEMFFTNFVIILLLSCVAFFWIVSNPGTILEVTLTSLSPISKFKEVLLSFIRPAKKSVFGIHNPTTGSKILFELQVDLSQLKGHKTIHNFVDTPSDLCICNVETENIEHCFCRYSLFSIQRRILVDTVSDIFSQKKYPY